MALPSEHGGWSLTLEPVALGLLVAPSWPGLALGAAALVAFVARTPLKVVLVDRWRHRWLARTRLASLLATAELALLGALGALAAAGSPRGFWVPLALAAPLVALELWYGMRSRSRRLIPELAGTIGIGSVAAAIALAGGAGTQWALGLWCVVAARSLAAIPNVRTQLRRTGADRPGARSDRSARCWHSDLAQALGLGGVLTGWLAGAVPLAAVLAIAAMAAANTTAVRMRPRPAAVIGIQQALTGIAVVAVTAVAAPPT